MGLGFSPSLPRLKGSEHRHPVDSDSESPAVEVKDPLEHLVRRGRKSINKTVQSTIDAANIPLPDSPLAT